MAKNKKPAKGAAGGSATKVVAANRSALNPLAALVQSINKDMGSESAIVLGDNVIADVAFMSTGITNLDAVMGGGIPRGRIIEIFGMESSGKTTTTLEIIASCQRTYFDSVKRKGVCAFIDVEHALDREWAENIGVDMSKLLFAQPSSGEEVVQIVERIVKSGLVDLIVVDSIAAMVPKSEIDGEITDNPIGAHARLMSQAMRRLHGPISKSNTAVVFINQLRQKVGFFMGSPDTTPGGLAMKFYASIRIDLRRGEMVTTGGEAKKPIGVGCKAKIIKNKVAPPFRNTVYNIYFGHPPAGATGPVFGVDKVECLFDSGVHYKVIALGGSNYYYDGNKLGSGRAKAVEALMADKALAETVRLAVIAAAAPKKVAPSGATDDELADILDGADAAEFEDAGAADDDVGDDTDGLDEADAGGEDTVEEDLTSGAVA